MAALVRHFSDLDLAEEAFQEASLRALQNWPTHGPPRDAVAWLNAAIRGRAAHAEDTDGTEIIMHAQLPMTETTPV